MHKPSVVVAVAIVTLIFALDAFSWGIDALVHDGPVTCFDVDYSMDGDLFVVFQRDQSPSYPICCVHSVDRGRTWNELWCLEVAPWRLPKLETFIGEYRGQETVFVFYIDSDGRPTMLRVGVSSGGALVVDQRHVGDYRAALAEFDVARSYHVELGIPWPLEPPPEPEPSYDFSIVFMWRDMYGNDVYFFRSIDGGETWAPVHVVMSEFKEADTAGLAITWGPPDTYYYVYKGFCGTNCCSADSSHPGGDWREDPECYGPYWGTGRLNGYPGWWTPGRLVHDPSAAMGLERAPESYHSAVLAASFDPANPALWFASINKTSWYESSFYWSWTPPAEGGSGWRLRIRQGNAPVGYTGDIKGYRELGNPYLNMAEVYPEDYAESVPSEWLCVDWRWDMAAGLRDYDAWLPQVRCVNDYHTIRLFSPARPKLLYSPGSDPGGAGIVYAGYDLVQDPDRPEERIAQPGLFFDAPWFYPADAFDRPGEPYPFEPPDTEESEHPMMYDPEAEPPGIEFAAASTAVCREHVSHVIAVNWNVTGFSTGLAVSVEVEGSDGLLATHESDSQEGSTTLEVDIPNGGSVTITVTARGAGEMRMSARSLMLPPC